MQMKILNENDSNEYLLKQFETNQPFCVGRMGIVELNCLFWKISNKQVPQYLSGLLSNNAGVYGDCFEEWRKVYSAAVSNCDINVCWQDEANKIQSQVVLSALSPDSIKIANRAVEPFYFDNPWSQKLANKNVLVVSPFADTINKQYEHRDKIWNNQLVLPEFNLITYANVQSIGSSGPDGGWIDSLSRMKKEISRIDFDCAILGCGAYGVPLSSYIKNTLGKTAIYIGGGIQILFGIKGKRWDNHDEIKLMYNEYWTRPSFEETPNKAMTVENACYW